MIQLRSLTTIVALSAAWTSSISSAFSPSLPSTLTCDHLSLGKPSNRNQSVLQVGTTLPHQRDHSGGSIEDHNEHNRQEYSVSMPTPITVINSPQELADFLNQDDRICVIKFHAAWCKSCQRFGLKFQGLANQKTDWVDASENVVVEGPMRFGSIEFGANTGMCRELQIKRLPTVHFYQKGQQLDGFPCGPKKFPMLLEKIEQYQQASDAAVFDDIMQQGEDLMSSSEVTGVLAQLIEQEANGSLESAKTAKAGRNAKKWWDMLP